MNKNMLRDRRKELGLTMKEVASAVGVSEATVQRWEVGNIANMRRDRIQKLSEVLKISPIEIIDLASNGSVTNDFEETMLLKHWRDADEGIKDAVRKLLDMPSREKEEGSSRFAV